MTKRNYSKLFDFLSRKETPMTITLSFTEIEEIIDSDLPASDKIYNAWWSNNSGNHSHAKAWLEAGWKTKDIRLGESVTFYKMDL